MSTQARIVWDESFTGYNFGHEHPMNPVRLELTARLCREFGLFDPPAAQVILPDVPADDVLLTVHTPEYLAAVKEASADPAAAKQAYGLGTDDDPAFVGIHEVSARIVAGTLDISQAVWRGESEHGVNFCGGLHHAMPGYASGFCIYNDAAVAINWLLENGASRVAYVDVDAHHGDGVERIFWNDPRVMTISLHETGTVLFPGTGFAADIGGPNAMGTAINLALPPGVSDGPWLRGFHAVVPALLRAFLPEVIVTQHGADSHFTDPLAHLGLSVDAQVAAMEALHDLSHELCGGKWVALGGGGYEVIGVVPRTWTHLTALALHRPIDLTTPVPPRWLEEVKARFGVDAPDKMGDGVAERGRIWFRSWESGFDPSNAVDRAVIATREACFPHQGLDVFFD
ncbi:MAG: acetoin utilization protein AcuC [Austwickia sp.]|nr:acetoin utilization protein AcuC [Austwickia sp.]MBK8436641.1 acetoin utilization protein AcuC [Austwickia sp.]MBK9100273.1 acetoin utilization protein AcuC [Austwickia sp.]